MARLLCPKCSTTFTAASGEQPLCPNCGYTTSAPVAPAAGSAPSPAAQPTYGQPYAYPGQPPPPAGGYSYGPAAAAAPEKPVIPPEQQRTAPLAIASLICSLLPFGAYFLGPLFARTGGEDVFFVFAPIALVSAVLAIVFGAVALGQIKKDPYLKGRGIAITGLVIGIVQVALTVVAFLLAVLVVAAVAAACGGCSAPAAFVHWAHAAPAVSRRRRVADFLLAHHPDCGLYERDVFRLGSLRLCVGCVTAGAVGGSAIAALWVLGPALPAWQWIALGVVVGSAQFLSIAGWTSTRGRKVIVKALLGVGAAAAGYGLLVAPWPESVRLGLLVLGGVFAMAFMAPRAVRMVKACEGHAEAAAT